MHHCTRADKASRHAGKRLVTQPLIKGKNPEVWFDKDVRSLADGDVYMDPLDVEKKLQKQTGGKPLSEKAFFPPKSSKQRCELVENWSFFKIRVCDDDTSAMRLAVHSLVM